MRHVIALLAAVLLGASPAAAQTDAQTGAPADPRPSAEQLDPLFDRLARAPTAAAAQPIADALWRAWSVGPTSRATQTLQAGRDRIASYDFAGALAILSPLTEAEPDFAEAWNQKAFAHFLRDEYDEALDDLGRALALEPRHFGALGGKAIILMRQGRMALGQKTLREALAVHPWLAERAMLLPDPPAEDI